LIYFQDNEIEVYVILQLSTTVEKHIDFAEFHQ